MDSTLTAAQRPHFSVLRVNLGDVGQPAAQVLRCDVITKLIFPFSRFHASSVNLGATVGCRRLGDGEIRVRRFSEVEMSKRDVQGAGF